MNLYLPYVICFFEFVIIVIACSLATNSRNLVHDLRLSQSFLEEAVLGRAAYFRCLTLDTDCDVFLDFKDSFHAWVLSLPPPTAPEDLAMLDDWNKVSREFLDCKDALALSCKWQEGKDIENTEFEDLFDEDMRQLIQAHYYIWGHHKHDGDPWTFAFYDQGKLFIDWVTPARNTLRTSISFWIKGYIYLASIPIERRDNYSSSAIFVQNEMKKNLSNIKLTMERIDGYFEFLDPSFLESPPRLCYADDWSISDEALLEYQTTVSKTMKRLVKEVNDVFPLGHLEIPEITFSLTK